MINKYRKKFIIVAMISLFVVIAIMIGLTNIINYVKTCKDSDETIQTIVNKEGPFGPPLGGIPPMDGSFRDREEAFRTRYFSVIYNIDGEEVASNIENINLTSAQASEIAKEVYEKNTSKGFYQQYRFNIIERDGGTMVFLLDCTKERMANNAFLITSLLISLGAYLGVFILLVIVSKIVVRPFYENMEKQKRFITDASHELKTPR